MNQNSWFRSDQHLSEEGIAAYAESLLNDRIADLQPELQAHVEVCESCRREAIELYGLIANMPANPAGEPHQDEPVQPSVSRLHPAWRWSLVALTAILAFWVFQITTQKSNPLPEKNTSPAITPELLINPQQQPERPVAEVQKPAENLPKQEGQALLAANFIPDEQLEGLAGEVMRSTGIEVLMPSVNQTFKPGTSVSFQWKQDEPLNLQLILLDNTGKELLSKALSNPNFEWNAPKRPGLYYWKLESSDELLFVGKFLLQ